jgi:hypothetical protein
MEQFIMETVFNIYIFQSSTHSYYWFSDISFHLPFFYASTLFSHFLSLFIVTLYSIFHALHILFPFVSFLGEHNHLFSSLYLVNLLPLPCFFFLTIYLQFSLLELTLIPFFSLYNAHSFVCSIFIMIF